MAASASRAYVKHEGFDDFGLGPLADFCLLLSQHDNIVVCVLCDTLSMGADVSA